jgi:methylenetetrahydrofolate dehydrogenase (NADP+) / methenyltetrahydrofolate cyclohydrolase
MIIDGKQLAQDATQELASLYATLPRQARLGIVVAHSTPEIELFVRKKRELASVLGVAVEAYRPRIPTCTEDEIRAMIARATEECDGVIVQLPLPSSIDTQRMLAHIPATKDVDVLGAHAYAAFVQGKTSLLPPVVGAMQRVLQRAGVYMQGMRVVVVGHGRLVGAPAAVWARREGAEVVVVTKNTPDIAAHTRTAEVLMLGAGVSGLITPEMVCDGVVVLDAGTSEAAGKLRGDADPRVAEKASVFTPTPGGIGPLTVVEIFANLYALVAKQQETV